MMQKKNKEIQREALEIVELAIDDLTSLARAFDMIAELGERGCDFNHIDFCDDCEAVVH